MPVEFQCSQCSKVLRVPDGSAGKKAKCPNCAAIVEVPEATPPPAEGDEFNVAPPQPSSGSQAGANPFADAKRTSPFSETSFDPKNPYASPSYSSVVKPGRSSSDERRTGPPWERDGQSAGTFFATVGEVFGQTNSMFATMRRRGGFGLPMGFAVVGGMIGVLAGLVYQFLFAGLGAAAGGDPDVVAQQMIPSCGSVICAPVIIIILLFIGSFMIHLLLMLVGGTENGFDELETTFRVFSYVYGATALLGLIPFCGGCIQWIVGLVFAIIGIASAHETSAGRAAAAVLLSFAICFALPFAVLMVFVFVAAAGAGGGF